jgi:hypothetical protein
MDLFFLVDADVEHRNLIADYDELLCSRDSNMRGLLWPQQELSHTTGLACNTTDCRVYTTAFTRQESGVHLYRDE